MSDEDSQPLDGTTVGIYIAPKGTEEVEFTEPKNAVSEAGAQVEVLGSESGEALAVNNDLDQSDTYDVDTRFADASIGEYDALLIPGGTVGADKLRLDEDAVDLLRHHIDIGHPVGVICHGPWMLIEAGVVDDRTLTSYPSLKTDIRNAGGEWVDEDVVTHQGIVTSRTLDDLTAFCDAIVESFATIPAEQ